MDLGITFIGPTLWSRIKNEKTLSKIKGGDIIIKGVDKKNPTGKATSNKDDFKLVWDYIRDEIGQNKFSFRKLNYDELNYYWYIISFDIEEPLFIVYTDKHNYLINLDPKELKITWLDEVPQK